MLAPIVNLNTAKSFVRALAEAPSGRDALPYPDEVLPEVAIGHVGIEALADPLAEYVPVRVAPEPTEASSESVGRSTTIRMVPSGM